METVYLKALFWQLPTPTVVVRTDAPVFSIADLNAAYERLSGSKKSALLGQSVTVLAADNSPTQQPLLASLQRVLHSAQPDKLTTRRFLTPEGSERFVEIHHLPLLNDQGQVHYILHQLVDVTELVLRNQQAEKQVERNLNLLHRAEQISKLGTWELNLVTGHLIWSDGVFRMLGYSPGEIELNANTANEIVHPDDRERVQQALDLAIREHGECSVQKRLVGKDAQVRQVLSRAVVSRDQSGEPVGIFGVYQDITDLSELTRHLREEQQLAETLVEQLPAIYFVFNEHGKMLNWNRKLETTTGYSHGEISTMHPLDFCRPADHEAMAAAMSEGFETGKVSLETYLVAKDGHEMLFYLTGAATWYNQQYCLIGTGFDISAHRQTMLELNLLINNTEESYVLLDKELNILSYNVQFNNLYHTYFGIDVQKGACIIDYAQPERREIVRGIYDRVIHHGETFETDITIPVKNGQPKVFHLSYKAARNQQRDVVGAFVTARDVTEIRATTRALEQSEASLRKVMDQSMDVICTANSEGFLEVSAAALSVWGYTPEEMRGQPLERFIHPDDLESTLQEVNGLLSGKTVQNFENRYLHKSGRVVHMLWSANYDSAEGIMYSVAKDITETVETRQRMQASEKRFRSLVENSTDATGIFSIDGKPLYLSPSVRNVLGYTEEEAMQLDLFALLHPDDIPAIQEVLGKALAQPGVTIAGLPGRMKHKDGSWRYIYGDITNMLHDPDIQGIVDNFRDVTDLITREQDLLASNRRFEYVTKATFDAIWDYDIEKGHVYRGDGYSTIFGYSRKELDALEGDIGIFVHPSDQERTKASFSQAIRLGWEFWSEEYRFRKKDGTWVFVQDRGVLLKNANGEVVRMIGAMRDVGDSRYMQLLQNLENEVLEMFVMEQHDLRKVLTHYMRGMERLHPGMLCSMLEVSGGKVYNLTSPSLSPSFLAAIHGEPIGPNAGSCGTAAFLGERVIVTDIAKDPLWSRYRVAALAYGLKACWSQPIIDVNGRVVATFAAYYEEPKGPDRLEEQTIDRARHFLQVILASDQREANLRLLESVITHTSDTVIITEADPLDAPGPRILYVNKAFTDMTGYEAEEVIGVSPRILQGPLSDRAELDRLRMAMRKWQPCEITTVNYRKNGEPFWVNIRVNPVANENGIHTHWIAIERDVTHQKSEEQQYKLIARLSQLFSEDKAINQTLEAVLAELARFGQFAMAEAWIVSADQQHLNLIATYADTETARRFYEAIGNVQTLGPGQGLPGHVWQSRKASLWQRLSDHPHFLRKAAAQVSGLLNAYGLPMIHNDEVVGVLVLGLNREETNTRSFDWLLKGFETLFGTEIRRKLLEEELRQIFHSAPDIICIADMQGYFRKVNPAMTALLEYSELELKSSPLFSFVHPDDQDPTAEKLSGLFEGISVISFENRYITKSGKVRWLSWNANLVPSEGMVYAVAKDVTEKKELEELVQKASRMAKIGSWEVDLIDNYLYWSDITRAIHEVSADYEPALAPAIRFYKEGESRDTISFVIQEAIDKGKPWDVELQLVTATGKTKWVRTIGQAELLHGKCIRLYGSIQDIDDRKRSELQLEQSNRNLVTTLESIQDGFFAVDQHWTVTYWNQEAERMLGAKRNAVLGRMLWDVFPESNGSAIQQKLRQSMQEGKPFRFEEYYDVKGHWYDMSAFPTGSGLTVYFKDISFKKQIEAQLQLNILQIHAVADANSALLTEDDWLKALQSVLPALAISVNADRMYYYENGFHAETREPYTSAVLEWCKPDITPQLESPHQIQVPFSLVPEFIEPLQKGKPLQWLLRDIPASFFREVIAEQDIKSFLVLPVMVGKRFHGFIGFDDCTTERHWTKEEISLLQTIASNLSTAIERKEAKEALISAFDEKNTILESIGDAFFAVDRQWVVNYWNNMAEEVLSTPRQKVLGKPLWEVFTTSVGTRSYQMYSQAMETGVAVHFEDYHPPLRRWYEISAYPSAAGLSVYFKDITLRKETDQRIRESNERFEKATEATNDAIWDWDVPTDTLHWGLGYSTLFGYDAGVVPSDSWSRYIHPGDKEATVGSLNQLLADTQETHWRSEYRFSRADGTYAYVIDRGILIRDEKGQPQRMVGAMTDISQIKEYEESLKELNHSLEQQAKELARSNEELEQFAYVASHDLQEPLRMVTGFLTQLEKKYAGKLDERALKYIHFAVEGAKRMRQIILDLLEYSRIGKNDDQVVKINLNDLLADIVLLNGAIIEEKKAVVTYDLPEIRGYRTPVMQILANLVGNALKYTRAGVAPRVEVFLQDENKQFWTLAVKDNGIGIHHDYFDKIFNIFQRLHHKEEYSGTGMGLAIVKKTVENLGGTIRVTSEEGAGSTFYFTLPKPGKKRKKN